MRADLVILIPTCNHAEHLKHLWARLAPLRLETDVLFVDNASSDGSGRLLEELAGLDARVSVERLPVRVGIGAAHLFGINRAYERGYRTVVTIDAGFYDAPESIPFLLSESSDCDLVVGSRVEGTYMGWSDFRSLRTRATRLLAGRLLGLPFDATSSFRLYRLRQIPQSLFRAVSCTGAAFFPESAFLIDRSGLRIREVPVVIPIRAGRGAGAHGREAVREILQYVRLLVRRPFRNPKNRFRSIPAPEIRPVGAGDRSVIRGFQGRTG